MPHIIIEYSNNITEYIDFKSLSSELTHLFHEIAGAEVNDCKIRFMQQNHYFIGDQNSEHAFVHLTVFMMVGRTDEVKKQLLQTAAELLQRYFSTAIQPEQLKLQATVHIQEILPDHYYKVLL